MFVYWQENGRPSWEFTTVLTSVSNIYPAPTKPSTLNRWAGLAQNLVRSGARQERPKSSPKPVNDGALIYNYENAHLAFKNRQEQWTEVRVLVLNRNFASESRVAIANRGNQERAAHRLLQKPACLSYLPAPTFLPPHLPTFLNITITIAHRLPLERYTLTPLPFRWHGSEQEGAVTCISAHLDFVWARSPASDNPFEEEESQPFARRRLAS